MYIYCYAILATLQYLTVQFWQLCGTGQFDFGNFAVPDSSHNFGNFAVPNSSHDFGNFAVPDSSQYIIANYTVIANSSITTLRLEVHSNYIMRHNTIWTQHLYFAKCVISFHWVYVDHYIISAVTKIICMSVRCPNCPPLIFNISNVRILWPNMVGITPVVYLKYHPILSRINI